jgi:hypothetical protein
MEVVFAPLDFAPGAVWAGAVSGDVFRPGL